MRTADEGHLPEGGSGSSVMGDGYKVSVTDLSTGFGDDLDDDYDDGSSSGPDGKFDGFGHGHQPFHELDADKGSFAHGAEDHARTDPAQPTGDEGLTVHATHEPHAGSDAGHLADQVAQYLHGGDIHAGLGEGALDPFHLHGDGDPLHGDGTLDHHHDPTAPVEPHPEHPSVFHLDVHLGG